MTRRRTRPQRGEAAGAFLFLSPYGALFLVFIVLPVLAAVGLSLTYFDTVQRPSFIGLANYVSLVTRDEVFMQHVLPNTLRFALLVGPGGYVLAFVLAWSLAQVPKGPRTLLALAIYSPSLAGGIVVAVLWSIVFSGDRAGYLNSLLLSLGWIREPIQWLQSATYLMPIMMVVTLWSSMGVGFLAMLAGVLNINPDLYEAAYIDGMKNRAQEIVYITVPSMRPQMLFGAVMAVVGTFQAGAIGVQLSGANPTPQYAGQLIVNHIEDFGFQRYEMGYAASLSVVLLLAVYGLSRLAWRLFGEGEGSRPRGVGTSYGRRRATGR